MGSLYEQKKETQVRRKREIVKKFYLKCVTIQNKKIIQKT